MSSVERQLSPNQRLAQVMKDLQISNKGLAHRMQQCSQQDGGQPVRPTHTTVARYIAGRNRPRPRTLEVLAAALGEKAGRSVTPEEIGYQEIAPPPNPSEVWSRWAERQLAEKMNRQLREIGINTGPAGADAEREAQAGRGAEIPSSSTGNASLDELDVVWRAKHPDREGRVQARRDAQAVHFAMSSELDAMQEAGMAELMNSMPGTVGRSALSDYRAGTALADRGDGHDRGGWER
ncbi:MAG: hypothetical protein JWN03_4869 [Nocardia sp.]|uniref:hypothetical protein n=1 Tax=Nocardia sp. TaxID=1821 RepID=UPI00261AB6C4|nr:hypothetical protein [Nocardia sp.]MCU1644594.1 hypothetical protein [Nocardia sp.]